MSKGRRELNPFSFPACMQMLLNFYKSTFLPCLQTGEPFAADAIISNPPAFGHVHIAEALSIPLTMTFSKLCAVRARRQLLTAAFHSHAVVEDHIVRASTCTNKAVQRSERSDQLPLFRHGRNAAVARVCPVLRFCGGAAVADKFVRSDSLGAKINRFRTSKLGLDKLSIASGASALDRLKVPYLYTWSSALIPKPDDWKQHIDVTGFLFLDNHAYRPPRELADFLAAGSPPIYIG